MSAAITAAEYTVENDPEMTLNKPDRSDKTTVEQGHVFMPLFDEHGLIPVVTTCAETGKVLMQAYMNADAISATLETGQAHYWSRSRQTLWHKGATSGEIQIVKELLTDCDQDSLWMIVQQKGGGCCHVGYPTCFYRRVVFNDKSQQQSTKLEYVAAKKE